MNKQAKLVGVTKCDCCGNDILGTVINIEMSSPTFTQGILYDRTVCVECYKYLDAVLSIAMRLGGQEVVNIIETKVNTIPDFSEQAFIVVFKEHDDTVYYEDRRKANGN